MKRLVLGSVALIAANLISGSASAEPLEVKPFLNLVTGIYLYGADDVSERIVGADGSLMGTDTDDAAATEDAANDAANYDRISFQSLGVESDGELGIMARQEMDNGYHLTAKVRWDLNLDLDEYNIAMRGGFGKFVLGGDDTAAKNMHYSVPHFTPGGEITSLDSPDIRPIPRVSAPTTTFIEITGDNNKLSYYTPRLQGLKVGLSYIPDADDAGQADQRDISVADSGFESLYTLSGNYHRPVAGGLLGLSYGYMSGAGPDDDPSAMSAGINFKTKRWIFGGAWFTGNDLDLDLVNDEHERFSLGLSYGVGPWTVGAAYISSEREIDYDHDNDSARKDGTTPTSLVRSTLKTSVIQLGTVYELGRNLNAGFDVQIFEDEDPRTQFTQTENVDGYSVGFLLSASF